MKGSKLLPVFLVLAVLILTTGVSNGASEPLQTHPKGSHPNGYWCFDCHDFDAALPNVKWVKTTITLKPPKSGTVTVDYPVEGAYVKNSPPYNGPCQACHDTTNHYRRDGTGIDHFIGGDCSTCHSHWQTNMFTWSIVGGQSHETHMVDSDTGDFDPKGPQIEDCTDCHAPDFSGFGPTGDPLETTTVCDPCHSPGGAFDGVGDLDPGNPNSVAYGAKLNWVDAIYNETGTGLKAGKEKWCATCHDRDLLVPDSKSEVKAVAASSVIGDESQTYGFYVSGHGKDPVNADCRDCHDPTLRHVDGEARTYSAASGNYRAGYRLNEDMAVPRDGETHPVAFRLCTNCHVYSDIIGNESNFRDDGTGQRYHDVHLNWFPAWIASDSDFDGVDCSAGTCRDSAVTCVNCHNVMGPPNPAMIRHGELMSTPGTSDKVPALDFHWYKANGTTETTVLGESWYGSLICGLHPDASVNHVCSGCHGTGELKWYRNPAGPQGITLDAVWTTDTSDVTQTEFYPTEPFRVHTRFRLVGTSGPYFVQITNSAVGNSPSMPGTDWSLPLNKQGTVGSGTFEVQWQGNIPATADPGSPAKVRIRIYVFDSEGGTLLDQDEMLWDFSIVAGP